MLQSFEPKEFQREKVHCMALNLLSTIFVNAIREIPPVISVMTLMAPNSVRSQVKF